MLLLHVVVIVIKEFVLPIILIIMKLKKELTMKKIYKKYILIKIKISKLKEVINTSFLYAKHAT